MVKMFDKIKKSADLSNLIFIFFVIFILIHQPFNTISNHEPVFTSAASLIEDTGK